MTFEKQLLYFRLIAKSFEEKSILCKRLHIVHWNCYHISFQEELIKIFVFIFRIHSFQSIYENLCYEILKCFFWQKFQTINIEMTI